MAQVAQGQVVVGLGVLEEGVLAPVKKCAVVRDQRRNPVGVRRVEPVWQGDEGVEVLAGVDRPDLEGSVQMTPSSRPIFAKASRAKSI